MRQKQKVEKEKDNGDDNDRREKEINRKLSETVNNECT